MDALFVRVETVMLENKGNAGRKFAWEIPVVNYRHIMLRGAICSAGFMGELKGLRNILTYFACKA